MTADGNGWTRCARGHRHWGRFGAAGILVTDYARVLLQYRAGWTHEGECWAVPGGARDSHENALGAALREAGEETTLDPATITPFAEWTDEHGGWAYTTVLARTEHDLVVEPANAECEQLRWWSLHEVAELPLHRGFAHSWPQLQQLIHAERGRSAAAL